MKLREAYEEGRNILEKADVPEPDLDAYYLLEYVTGVTRAQFYAYPETKLDQTQEERYRSCISERAKRIPLQHITGFQEFMGLEFDVNGSVLIPRQDTEILVEEALHLISSNTVPDVEGTLHILDMCTGSGCILLSLMHWADRAIMGTGADISRKAVETARMNGKKLQKDARFVQSDLFENISGTFGMILANPPYIKSDEIQTLQAEVRLYDPPSALDGKEDGLFFYRRITEDSRNYLDKDGWLLYEIGYDQAEDVSAIMKKAGFSGIRVKKDLAGLDRVVYGRYSG